MSCIGQRMCRFIANGNAFSQHVLFLFSLEAVRGNTVKSASGVGKNNNKDQQSFTNAHLVGNGSHRLLMLMP